MPKQAPADVPAVNDAPKQDAPVEVQHVDANVKDLNLFVKDVVVEFRNGVAKVKADLAKELKKLGFVK